jgi:hypothetical protein
MGIYYRRFPRSKERRFPRSKERRQLRSEQQPQQQQPAPHGHALGSPGIGGLAQAPGEYTDEGYTAALLEGTMEAWKLCGFSAEDWEKLLLKEQLAELLVATVDWEKLVEEAVFRL